MAKNPVPHVLVFPFPAQGHVNSMLKLAEILSMAGGLHVTFLNTEFNHERLLRSTDAQTRFAQYPSFKFETIPDGLPPNHSRAFSPLIEVLNTIWAAMQPAFREILFSGRIESDGRPPVSCLIADGILTFTIDIAKELGIPAISFRTTSACYFWACYCIPKLIEAGEIPFEDENLDELITSVGGMEGFVRHRDLPSACRTKDINDMGLQLVWKETHNSTRATAHLLNTFEDLEGPILSHIRPHLPKAYTIGPLHALLDSRRLHSSSLSSSNSLLKMDRSCMTWLNSQPLKSVIYVSFGSVIFMTRKEMLEFWYGLINSGKRFLWVIRPDSVTDKYEEHNDIPEELREGTKERGYMVDWCPQEEVLAHEAIGGFLTHSGWNSTLESIAAGVPMICWPHFADQQPNSRYVSEAWKVGLDMKDKCDRSTVEKMVRDIMEDRREEIMVSVDKMAMMAKRSIREGGSSFRNMDQLIQDIKLMSLEAFDSNS